jgi:branched-chain amino acid transport system substrate-binding protein
LFNISVVDPNEIVKLAGVENAHGLAISQVVPYPYMANLPVIREYQELLKKYAPKERVNYTSFEEFLGAKVLVEGLRRAGPNPTRAGVIKGLESLHEFDLGGVRVNYGPQNRVGSKLVDITVIDSSGKLLK